MPTKHFVFSPYVLSSSWKLFFSLSFLNLLLRWFGGVLVAQFDRAASQVLFLDPPIPWGKVPSKNLLGHQKLIGPTPRPASHWLVPTNFAAKLFRGSILLLRLHLRARRSCDICLGNYIWNYICLGNYSTSVFLGKLASNPTWGLQPHKSRPPQASNTYFVFWRNITYFTFCSFRLGSSGTPLRIEHVPLHVNGKSRERDFSGINFVFVEGNFSNLMQMWGKCVKQTAGIRPSMDWVHLLGHLLVRTKVKSGLIEIFLEVYQLKVWKERSGGGGKAELDFAKWFLLLFEATQHCYRGGRRKCLRPCTAFASTLESWNALHCSALCCSGAAGRDQGAVYCSLGQQQGLACLRLARHWGAPNVSTPLCSQLCTVRTLHCCSSVLVCSVHCAASSVCRLHYAVSSQESWLVEAQTSRQARLPSLPSSVMMVWIKMLMIHHYLHPKYKEAYPSTVF